jgi:glycosyltransferase involved in cell wall biosynthesis
VKIYELHAARYDPTAVIRVAKIVSDENVDVVHTHLKHADVVGGLAALLARVPSVSTLHVIDIPTSRMHRLRVNIAARARRLLSDTVIALSTEQNDWYRQYAGPHPNVAMVPNGVIELEVSRDRATVRSEIGVSPETTLALVLSLMKPVKGHAQLLEAIRLVPLDVPVTFALAGDGPLLDEVRSTVEGDRLLRGRVRILGFRTDVADLLAACDFVVHPSIQDALPTALISALAAGRPIVATNVGGIPDIVGPGCGVLVEPADPAALSAAIVDMTELIRSEPTRAEDIRRAGREMYENRFSADMWVDNLRTVYGRLIRL